MKKLAILSLALCAFNFSYAQSESSSTPLPQNQVKQRKYVKKESKQHVTNAKAAKIKPSAILTPIDPKNLRKEEK